MGQGRPYATAIVVGVLLVCLVVLGARWNALGQRVPIPLPEESAVGRAMTQAAGMPATDANPPPQVRRAPQRDDPQRAAPQPATSGRDTQPIDINAANAAELDQLPGIGPVLAGRIIEYRERHGPFESLDGLLAVSGIGEKKLAALRGLAVCSRSEADSRRGK